MHPLAQGRAEKRSAFRRMTHCEGGGLRRVETFHSADYACGSSALRQLPNW
jgi:hypothetical protein